MRGRQRALRQYQSSTIFRPTLGGGPGGLYRLVERIRCREQEERHELGDSGAGQRMARRGDRQSRVHRVSGNLHLQDEGNACEGFRCVHARADENAGWLASRGLVVGPALS
jgi:hypothetical protein